MVKYFWITIGSIIFGMGLSLFIDPNDFAPGGVSGLSVILNRLIKVETGTLFLIINIPIMIFGAWKFGIKFMVSTLYAILIVSMTTNTLERFEALTYQPFLASIFGGATIAVGMGLVLRTGATTGGTDVVVKYVRQRKPYIKTGTLFLIVDAVIIVLCGLVFRNVDTMLYSALSIMVTSQVLDLVLYGKDEAKLIYIISDASMAITDRILKELNIGVTHLSGRGGYKQNDKQVILCVVKKQNSYRVEEIVKQEDDESFMIISDASEIYGEGYKSYFGERL